MISAKAPGKLYIAGEYAVVNHGYPSVLVAVNRFITVSIEPTTDEGTIISRQYAHIPLKWKRIDGRFVIEKRDNPYHYILEAINVTESYARELNRPMKIYDLWVDSELDSAEGAKYGLGSSAAVTIATIRALFQLYEIEEDGYKIYKLAALAHLKLGSNGSFGDLAASVMTGWSVYQSFDREWVTQKSKEVTLRELIKLKWPSLLIEKLEPLTDYELIIGWTKSPASTSALVDKVKKEVDPSQYARFLADSKECVTRLIAGIKANDGKLVNAMIHRNRELLKGLDASIETSELCQLIEIANEYGAGKTSGAGGGDCGIVLVHKATNLDQMVASWQQLGIEKLNITVYDENNLVIGEGHHES